MDYKGPVPRTRCGPALYCGLEDKMRSAQGSCGCVHKPRGSARHPSRCRAELFGCFVAQSSSSHERPGAFVEATWPKVARILRYGNVSLGFANKAAFREAYLEEKPQVD